MSNAYPDISADLGKRLKKTRDAVSLSQKELAAHLGVSERTLQGWEAGTAFPQPRHRRAVLAFLAEAKAAA